MKLIANRPCSFGGRQFYIGDEIPAGLVADVKRQEQYGVITMINAKGVSGGNCGTFLAQEQNAKDMAELQEYRKLGVTPEQIKEMDVSYAKLAQELAKMRKEVSVDSRKNIKKAAKKQADKSDSPDGSPKGEDA